VENPAMIDLSQAQVIGAGHERVCYRHPANPRRVIKVSRMATGGRQQNRIDHCYLASLEARGVPTTHVPRQYGLVTTSLGEGLELDCITTADDQIAPTMEALLRAQAITVEEARTMLTALYTHLLQHSVVMVDIGLGNLVCRQVAGRWQAVVIDGLGARHPDLRLWLRTRFLFLARRKLRAQWSKWEEKLLPFGH
jgi:hypothetical protein